MAGHEPYCRAPLNFVTERIGCKSALNYLSLCTNFIGMDGSKPLTRATNTIIDRKGYKLLADLEVPAACSVGSKAL